jgi:hypothetical protein
VVQEVAIYAIFAIHHEQLLQWEQQLLSFGTGVESCCCRMEVAGSGFWTLPAMLKLRISAASAETPA